MRVLGQRAGVLAMLGGVLVVIALAAIMAPRAARSADGRVNDDLTVLAHVPARQTAAGARLATLRAQQRAKPNDLTVALALARAHIEASRLQGDPRPLGYAEAALSRWTALSEPPAAALV